jgi:16S rRNA (uracil1498-N3)-methyltransferase
VNAEGDGRGRGARRLCVPAEALVIEPIQITGAALRHLQVLRLQRGDSVCLFDGRGREILARLSSVSADRALATPLHDVDGEVESPLACWVVQAIPVRPQRMDLVVRQLTEIGVVAILPVLSERSQSFARVENALRKRHQRWERIAAAAAEQSHRRRVPRICAAAHLAKMLWDEMPTPVLLLDPGEDAPPLREITADSRPQAVTVMIGPEGGWSKDELDLMASHGAQVVSLGPRVLRTETAGLAAVSILMHRWGDLG